MLTHCKIVTIIRLVNKLTTSLFNSESFLRFAGLNGHMFIKNSLSVCISVWDGTYNSNVVKKAHFLARINWGYTIVQMLLVGSNREMEGVGGLQENVAKSKESRKQVMCDENASFSSAVRTPSPIEGQFSQQGGQIWTGWQTTKNRQLIKQYEQLS